MTTSPSLTPEKSCRPRAGGSWDGMGLEPGMQPRMPQPPWRRPTQAAHGSRRPAAPDMQAGQAAAAAARRQLALAPSSLASMKLTSISFSRWFTPAQHSRAAGRLHVPV